MMSALDQDQEAGTDSGSSASSSPTNLLTVNGSHRINSQNLLTSNYKPVFFVANALRSKVNTHTYNASKVNYTQQHHWYDFL
jgi:hypothetical protein